MRPSPRGTSEAARYGGAFALAAAAVTLRFLFPRIFNGAPYVTSYLAVLAAAKFLGSGPALLVMAIGTLAGVIAPLPGYLLRLLLYFVANLLVIWVVHVLRVARRAAADRASALEAEIVRRSKEEARSAQ